MSHEPKRWDDTGLAKALKYWPLVISAFALVFSLGTSSGTIKELDRKIEHESEVNDQQAKQIAALEETVKEIAEMKRDIKELLRRVR